MRIPFSTTILMRMLALAVVILLSRLTAADISIEIASASAQVEARFNVSEPHDSIRFSLIRVPGQKVEFVNLEGAGANVQWNEEAGLTWVTAALKEGRARVRYRVTGSLSRIPIPVPEVPAEPGAGAVTIKVNGLDATARFHEGFPRLISRSDGSAVARMDNVPSFLRQPPAQYAWSVNRGAQLLVVVLVVGASAAWAIHAHRRTRTGRG